MIILLLITMFCLWLSGFMFAMGEVISGTVLFMLFCAGCALFSQDN